MGGGMWGIRMTVMLLSLGQAPICTFQAQSNIILMPDFNIFQAKGAWNFIGMATNEKLTDQDKRDAKMSPTVFFPFANGSVNLQTTILLPEGDCVEVNATYTRVNKSEQYKSDDGSPCFFQVIDTDYENYGIIYTGNSENKDDFQVKLYGRTKTVTVEVLKKFHEITKLFGIPEENMIMLSRSVAIEGAQYKPVSSCVWKRGSYQMVSSDLLSYPGEDGVLFASRAAVFHARYLNVSTCAFA